MDSLAKRKGNRPVRTLPWLLPQKKVAAKPLSIQLIANRSGWKICLYSLPQGTIEPIVSDNNNVHYRCSVHEEEEPKISIVVKVLGFLRLNTGLSECRPTAIRSFQCMDLPSFDALRLRLLESGL